MLPFTGKVCPFCSSVSGSKRMRPRSTHPRHLIAPPPQQGCDFEGHWQQTSRLPLCSHKLSKDQGEDA